MAAGQHNLSPDFAALIRATVTTVTRPPTILILRRETGEGNHASQASLRSLRRLGCVHGGGCRRSANARAAWRGWKRQSPPIATLLRSSISPERPILLKLRAVIFCELGLCLRSGEILRDRRPAERRNVISITSSSTGALYLCACVKPHSRRSARTATICTDC